LIFFVRVLRVKRRAKAFGSILWKKMSAFLKGLYVRFAVTRRFHDRRFNGRYYAVLPSCSIKPNNKKEISTNNCHVDMYVYIYICFLKIVQHILAI